MGNCSKGKSCKSTCINKEHECRVTLSPKHSSSLYSVAQKILLSSAPLKTEEQAVKWFESHKEQIALSGMGTWGHPNADMMMVMIEPGGNPREKQYDREGNLSPNLKRLEKYLGEEKPVVGKDWNSWYSNNLMFWLNDMRQEVLTTIAAKKAGKSREDISGLAKKLRNQDHYDTDGAVVSKMLQLKNKSPFTRKMLKVAEGVGARSIFTQNLSPFDLPSDKYWPFESLPWKKVLGRNSVLSSRKSWLEYTGKVHAERILKEVRENPRKLVWLSKGQVHTEMFDSIAQKSGAEVKTKNYEWNSAGGKKTVINLRYFKDKGTGTVFMSAPHPSYTSWRDQDLEGLSKELSQLN
jgi:hypothetical protein